MACFSFFRAGRKRGLPAVTSVSGPRGRSEREWRDDPAGARFFAGAYGSSLPGYWRRKVMRALSLSYGDISIFTRSPMTRRMKRLRILPEM